MKYIKYLTILLIMIAAVYFALFPNLSTKAGEQDEKIKEAARCLLEDDPQATLNILGNPSSGEAKFIEASALSRLGFDNQAIEAFKSVESPEAFILYDYAKFNIAEIYFNNKDYSKALQEYTELKENRPESILAEKAVFKISEIKAAQGKLNEAYSLLSKFINDNPESIYLPEARYSLGSVCERLGAWPEASKVYRDIITFYPFSSLAKDARARLAQIKRGHKLPSYVAPAPALFDKAMTLFNRQDYRGARDEFKNFVAMYPASRLADDALVMTGRSEFKRRLYSASILNYKKAIKYGGDQADAAQYYMAFSYGKLGNLPKTLASFQSVIDNYPRSEFVDDARYYIGYYYAANGNNSGAIRAFSNLLKYCKDSPLATSAILSMGRMYYKAGQYENAYSTFKKAKDFSAGDYSDECIFWEGKSAEKIGKTAEAVNAYKHLIDRFGHTYYSYRAKEKLENMGVSAENDQIKTDDLEGIKISWAGKNSNLLSLHNEKFNKLMELCFYKEAEDEALYISRIAPDNKKDDAKLLLSQVKFALDQYRESMVYAESKLDKALVDGELKELSSLIWKIAYPRAYFSHVMKYAAEYNLDPYFVLAVMREESRFNPLVTSWARAHGLMQIIPSTGKVVARLMGIRPFYNGRLFEPDTNIRMGCYYLSSLISRFDGNKYLALAAYNGGPNNVKKWLNKWWSKNGTQVDIDEFVEGIPLGETRRYVQKVMGSYLRYKNIYDGNG